MRRLVLLLLTAYASAQPRFTISQNDALQKLLSSFGSNLFSGGRNGNPSSDNVQSFCDAAPLSDSAVVSNPVATTCKREPINLLFILDGSGSVGADNFEKVKGFMGMIVEELEIGADDTRVAVVQFSASPRTEFSFDTHSDKAAVKTGPFPGPSWNSFDEMKRTTQSVWVVHMHPEHWDDAQCTCPRFQKKRVCKHSGGCLSGAIQGIRYRKGGTRVAAALSHAQRNELVTRAGWRPERKTVLVTITDGASSDNPDRVGEELRQIEGLTTIALGIEPTENRNNGGNIFGGLFNLFQRKPKLDQEQLLSLAGSKDRVFIVCDFARLDTDVTAAITRQICNEVDETCKKTYHDLIFLVDGSGSIGAQNFTDLKGFLGSLVETQEVGEGKSRVGLVQFSDRVQTEFSLTTDADQAQRMIRDMDWLRGKTRIGAALEHVRRNEISRSQRRDGVNPVVVVLTDGNSDDAVLGRARQLGNEGVTVFAVGIADGVDDKTLGEIAQSTDRVIRVRDFSQLDRGLKNALAGLICQEKPTTRVTGGLDYMGCFKQPRRTKTFRVKLPNSRTNNPSSCYDRCAEAGEPTDILGLEVGYCYCGTMEEVRVAEKEARDVRCNRVCQPIRENPDRVKCGGRLLLSVYSSVGTSLETTTAAPVTDRWGRTVRTTTTERPGRDDCEDVPLDLTFVVDGSSSIEADNFEKIKAFMKGVAASAKISNRDTKMAVVQFNDDPYTEFNFRDNSDQSRVEGAIDSIRWREGETNLEKALEWVERDTLRPRRGFRNRRAESVLVVLTDGESLGDPQVPAEKLRRAGTEIVAVGIGSKFDRGQLEEVVGRGYEQSRVFAVSNFEDLINGQINKRYSDARPCIGPLGPLGVGLDGSGGLASKGSNIRRKTVVPDDADSDDNDVGCGSTDVLVVLDEGMSGSGFEKNQGGKLLRGLVAELRAGGTTFAFVRSGSIIDVVHEFRDGQSAGELELAVEGALTARGTGNWARVKAQAVAKAGKRNEHLVVLYLASKQSSEVNSQVLRDVKQMRDRGAVVLPLQFYGNSRIVPLKIRQSLVGVSSEKSMIRRPSPARLIAKFQCQ